MPDEVVVFLTTGLTGLRGAVTTKMSFHEKKYRPTADWVFVEKFLTTALIPRYQISRTEH